MSIGSVAGGSTRRASRRWSSSTGWATADRSHPWFSTWSTTPVEPACRPRNHHSRRRTKSELESRFGIRFSRLLTLTNMPIRRFADHLNRTDQHEAYLSLLVNHFNPATVPDLMCTALLSVGYHGRLYDCDFNQMVDLGLGEDVETLWDLEDLGELVGRPIATGHHCFGCTAGSGSSCGGALVQP